MTEIADVAAAVTARAEQDEAADFDRQYELERRGERAVAAMREQGRERARRWAEDDRRDETDRRFDPEPEDPEPAAAARPPATASRRPRPVADEADDDPPTTWLR